MSLLYHPLSRTITQRDLSGCLTPNNQPEIVAPVNTSYSKPSSDEKSISSTATTPTTSTILSPPLSPYQRNNVTIHPPLVSEKSYITSNSPFKIENYQDYKLTVDAWAELGPSYKSHQLHFLNQYSVISQEEQLQQRRLVTMRRANATYKRKLNNNSDVDADSDASTANNTDRVRTRRVAKTSNYNRDMEFESGSEIDSAVPSTPPPKKQKKIRRDNTQSPSLALQQQMLIDETIPDYSPDPQATLPASNVKCLRIEWKGQPMDLSQDPNILKLHPSEVILASILRLPVAVYLDSKRRLFFEKVQRLKTGKQFRRTDAQKACRIDVNKASRLFAAFEKVGWLEDKHFSKFV
ncbi:uncharacterized protein RJT20DRAFT_37804 [Scheffersomyces xylosifermentans]|uniref:uncharacterized protein n=1 Tax=Scheffersomyces xylosifermentans TaxID=1304137 RepID=UPI00315DB43A